MTGFKHILVPYDFTNFADLAFKKAMEIATKFDSKISLITVLGSEINTAGMSYSRAQEVHDEMEEKTKGDLNRIKESSKNENVDVSVHIIHESSTVGGILSFAEKNNIDLIVIGSHGRSGFKKLVLGSVAAAIITKAQCPVMVVKPTKLSKN
ncbi:MAG TPA: universal stress protein [Nitrosopumilaceae archaeon]|nr:universal stress protein [Nitrosopumilaceae archaeon]